MFDLQPAVAREMGFQASGSRALSESLMQRYYLAAKAVTQLSTILLQSLEQRLLGRPPAEAVALDDDFDRIDDLLRAARAGRVRAQPAAAAAGVPDDAAPFGTRRG